ncbi:MAG: glycosyltransferase [Clostridia bacterium]|nr:glycosyltransferase [Clostridia bacterium]
MITVVIAVYNCEKYLRQCIDSVIKQTYQPLEIILVDDHSKDSSFAICQEYEKNHSNIRVVQSSSQSPGGTRNVGLRLVDTKYVYFLDCDDYINEQALQTLFDICEKNDLDMLTGEFVGMNEVGIIKEKVSKSRKETDILTGEEYLKFSTKNNYTGLCIWSNLYRTDLFKKNGIEFFEKTYFDDMSSFISIVSHCRRAKFIPYQFYYYRRHEGSIMTADKDWPYVFYDVFCRIKQTLTENDFNRKMMSYTSQMLLYSAVESLSKAYKTSQYMEYVSKFKTDHIFKKALLRTPKTKQKLLYLIYFSPKLLGRILSAIKKK